LCHRALQGVSWRLLKLLQQHEAEPWTRDSQRGLHVLDDLMRRPGQVQLLPMQLLLQETA
jgi:hypothetical protein